MRVSNKKKTKELEERKEKERGLLLKIMAVRKTISSLLDANLTFKLVSLAKDIPEMSFENLSYLKESILNELNKKELSEKMKSIVDFEKGQIQNEELLTELFNNLITVEYAKELLSKYNPTNYVIDKLNEAHKVVYENNAY